MLANASVGVGRRQRLSGAKRREAIVRAAMDLFAKNGFRGTTTRELASAVGVTEPVLYQHFATKKDLHGAIVDVMLAEVTATFEEQLKDLPDGASTQEFFEWLGRVIVGWYMNDQRYIRLLIFSALEGHELKDLWYERATSRFVDFVQSHVVQRMESGEFRRMAPVLASEAFIGMVAHFGLTSGIFQCHLQGLDPETVVKEYVQIFLDGVRRRTTPESQMGAEPVE